MPDSLAATSSSTHNHSGNIQKWVTDNTQEFNHIILLCVSLIPALLFALGADTDYSLLVVIAVHIVLKLKDNIRRIKGIKYTNQNCVMMIFFYTHVTIP